ncbi:MAG: four-carbon acid sugar kinase family protein [Alphaproteobacteria bacterium]|jgi:uncharacterized protein YgbK (DUF1537 family)
MRGMMKLCVIADDLTGANDTGIQFAKHGLSTIVALNTDMLDRTADRADVIVVNTDTRWQNAANAYERIRHVTEMLNRAGVSWIYKKIDSTLRGNIGAELDAVMDVIKPKAAFVVPAFPATGRVTLGGTQLLRNIPLHKTEVALDLLSPVKESHIPTLLSQQSRRCVGYVPLDMVKPGVCALRRSLLTGIDQGEEVLVVDAETQEELHIIMKAIVTLGCKVVVAGSAGAAAELPRALDMTRSIEPRRDSDVPKAVLVIAGSVNPTTREQLEYAGSVLGLSSIDINVQSILSGIGEDLNRNDLIDIVCSELSEGHRVILSLQPFERSLIDREGPLSADHTTCSQAKNWSNEVENSRKIMDYLGTLASQILSRCGTVGLILTGGDTAYAVCRNLGAVGIMLIDEITPGVPVGCLLDGPYSGLTIVTKAGGFGGVHVIAEAMRYLSCYG